MYCSWCGLLKITNSRKVLQERRQTACVPDTNYMDGKIHCFPNDFTDCWDVHCLANLLNDVLGGGVAYLENLYTSSISLTHCLALSQIESDSL